MLNKYIVLIVGTMAISTLISSPIFAADPPGKAALSSSSNGAAAGTTGAARPQATREDKQDARQLLREAARVIEKMKADPQLAKLIERSKGIYVVPDFGRGALVVGARGGAGVVLAHRRGKWSGPAFYDFGAISIGVQAGASGGSVAFLLMSDSAIDAFMSGNKISLNAEAGLSIIDYSANGQGSWGKGDIVMWSDNAGLYAGATISVSDVNWDDGNNRAFYGAKVEPAAVLNGSFQAPPVPELKNALPK